MAGGNGYRPGTFCWSLLASADVGGSKAFYRGLLGLEAVGSADWGENLARLCLDGNDVASLDELNPELAKHGVPSHWRSFIRVDDVGEMAARTTELGGTVLGDPVDMLDWGRVSPAFDPQGGAFALWEPRAYPGAARMGDVGSLCLHELNARDLVVARSFYTELFGWQAEEAHTAGVDYVTLTRDGAPVGGMQQQRPEWGDAPPTWLCYFRVESVPAAAARIAELGARIVFEPHEHPRGRFAVAHDPQDAVFAVLEPAAG